LILAELTESGNTIVNIQSQNGCSCVPMKISLLVGCAHTQMGSNDLRAVSTVNTPEVRANNECDTAVAIQKLNIRFDSDHTRYLAVQ